MLGNRWWESGRERCCFHSHQAIPQANKHTTRNRKVEKTGLPPKIIINYPWGKKKPLGLLFPAGPSLPRDGGLGLRRFVRSSTSVGTTALILALFLFSQAFAGKSLVGVGPRDPRCWASS